MTALLLDRPGADAEFARIIDELTRRGLLGGGLCAAALAGLAACGADGRPSSGGSPSPWTFTDDLGRKITLPRRPTRIAVTDDSPAASLWSVGVRLVAAPFASGDDPILKAGGVPLHGGLVPVAGPGGSGINLEALAKAAPDLIVATTVGGKIASYAVTADKIAPVAGLNFYNGSFGAVIGRISRLARALGADPTDLAAQQRYQQAAARLRKALAAKPGLRIAWMGTSSNGAWLNDPKSQTSLLTVAGLGADLYYPAGGASYSQPVSWELVPGLPVDFVILGAYPTAAAPSNPAWGLMPAVKAGQFTIFTNQWLTVTYANYATLLNQVAAAVEKAKPGVGPR